MVSIEHSNGLKRGISVVMATYNGVRYLREQLDSLLVQTLMPMEIIISDDGSTDGTWELLEEYAERVKKIRLFHNDGERGINGNFFSAMRKAEGEFIALCDQDDIWEKDKLECQMKAIADGLLCSCRSLPFSEDGFPVSNDGRKPNFHILRMAYVGVLPGHTLLIRHELLDELRGAGNFPYLYDWQLGMVASAADKIVYVDRVLVHFRRHRAAATATVPVRGGMRGSALKDYLFFSIWHHRELQAVVRTRFRAIERMLLSVGYRSRARDLCLEMAALQIEEGAWALLKRMVFFMKHRKYLFYAQSNGKSLATWLKAAIYPFTCGFMYRGAIGKK